MSGRSPDWIGEALRLAIEDLRSYLRTARAFSLAPYQSARAWQAGELHAMNPIGVLAAAAVVVQPVRQLAYEVLGMPSPDGLLAMLQSALGPFVHYAVLGVLVHLVLRGGARLTDSVAVSLYVGGGPAALAEVAAWLVTMAAHAALPRTDPRWLLGITFGVAFSVFCFALASGLAGLHRPSVARMLVAFLFAFAVTGLTFGALSPPGGYGMHWTVSVAPFRMGLGW